MTVSHEVKCIRAGCGYYTYEVNDYRTFIHSVAPLFVKPSLATTNGTLKEKPVFVWRGMRDRAWQLQSSLSRFASKEFKIPGQQWKKLVAELTTRHLVEFLNWQRGLGTLSRQHDELHTLLRQHTNKYYLSFDTVLDAMTPPQRNLTYELFSLGQHHGLHTPFLDWSYIPLIALYFAFEEKDEPNEEETGYRVVYALNKTYVETLCPPNESSSREDIRFMDTMAHENLRAVGQSGLFTFVPAHLPVDKWVVSRCRNLQEPVLLRFLIRNTGRSDCLEELASMNIQARTIFPDIIGASKISNFRLEQQRDLVKILGSDTDEY